jgi:MFS family permease
MANKTSLQQSTADRVQSQVILIALLFPTMANILNISMFNIALPTIRDVFEISADVAAWLSIAYLLPFMMLMPLFGRLGDEIGKSRLLIGGIIIFCVGSLPAMFANNLALLFLGRALQGAGAAGIQPLSLAILSERYPSGERGRAMGTWNSIAPASAIVGTVLGGLLVDSFGWRTIFIPVLAIGVLAIGIIRWRIPTLRSKPNFSVFRNFDWGGVLLLGGTIVSLVFYLSSRPVTGVEPLRDWRLLIAALGFGLGFVLWELGHQAAPLIDLRILKDRGFLLASLSAGVRMAFMAMISFLLPLYLTDIYNLSASNIGLLSAIHASALFVSIRFGGILADRYMNRNLIVISIFLQMSVMGYFALLPGPVSLIWIVAGFVGHGLGAGLSLAALHRTALGESTADQLGASAGVYSMTRFGGMMLSTTFAGVILQAGLDRNMIPLDAYQAVFGFMAVVGLFGVLLASRLRT